jgi:hypothetical protein
MSSTTKGPAPRIPLKLEVEYRKNYGRSGAVGEMKNISLTGAFLEHQHEPLKLNDKICITFKVGGRTRKINATVVWTNNRGSGLHFIPASNRDVQIVDDLMYFVESKRVTRRSLIDEIFKQAG